MSKIFFVATMHPEYADQNFHQGDVIIDPWRYVPNKKGVSVRRLGENKPELISILCPSRGRAPQLSRMVKSAFDHATHAKRVEVIVYLDEDDNVGQYTLNVPDAMSPSLVENLHFIIAPRILLSDTWNECFKFAKGDILMHAGDDIVFETSGWDQIVRNVFDSSEDKIWLVHGDDRSPNTDALATHGFLHRRWVETVGYFVPPLFSSDWNDVWLTDVADMIKRRVKVPIVTDHLHYSFGKAERDQNTAEREERGIRDNVVELYKHTSDQRKRDAEKLRKVLA